MTQQEKVSIIIPVYKVEAYLPACLESVLAQTYGALEVLIIDDGSPDNCPRICEEYAARDSRIRVIHQENRGLSAARNTGIENAQGEYLVFLDSDDTIEAAYVDKLCACMKEHACLMAACGRKYVYEDGKILVKVPPQVNTLFDFEQAIKEMNSFALFDMSATAKIFHRSLLADIRFPEGRLSEDYFVMYKIIDKAQRVGYISDALYNYLQRKNSICRNANINWDFVHAAKAQMDYLDKHYTSLTQTGHCAYASANLTVLDFYIKNGVSCPKEKVDIIRAAVRENLSYIRGNKELRLEKRIQFALFLTSYTVYRWVFKAYRALRRA